MPSDQRDLDHELRRQLRRELIDRRRPSEAAQVLGGLAPALKRARRLRAATTAGAVALTVGGVAAAAIVAGNDGRDSQPAWFDRGAPIAGVDEAVVVPEAMPDDVVTLPGEPSRSAVASAATDGVAPPGADRTGADGPSGEPVSTADDHTAADDSATTRVTEPSTTVNATSDRPGDDAVATTTLAVPTTTAPPATSLPDEARTETFGSACGDVLAVVGATRVEVVEVRPAPGYDFHLEDPDRGRITVQFTGGGEDCELEIGPTDDSDDG